MSYVNFSSNEIGECWYDSSYSNSSMCTNHMDVFCFFCNNEICFFFYKQLNILNRFPMSILIPN